MNLCRICFQEVTGGVPVPSWHCGEKDDRASVHEECLARQVSDFINEDPQKVGLLRYLVEFEESHAPEDWARDISGATADVSWTWDKVGIPTSKIMPLVNVGLLGIVFSSRSSTYYALVGRKVIKKVLEEIKRVRERESLLPIPDKEIEIPENLFSTVSGYEEIKAFLKKVLKAERFHVLLVGPPASAKTVFLLELARLPGSFYCLGSATTKAGIAEILYE
ncbi:MAG: hypothetical protein FJ006_00325 [Chloroflexi bacterium]|nr:hypothetical protein [Chloroflexota bacterium]